MGQSSQVIVVVECRPPGRAAGRESSDFGVASAYQLFVSDSIPVTFELVEGPQGLTVDSRGKVTWQAPKGILGRVPVSVQVTHPSDQRILHRFVIKLGGSVE